MNFPYHCNTIIIIIIITFTTEDIFALVTRKMVLLYFIHPLLLGHRHTLFQNIQVLDQDL